jgi:predicted ester cyclase
VEPEQARGLLRRAWDAYDRGDVQAFDACVTPEWRDHEVTDWDGPGRALDEIHAEMEEFREAFPDKQTEFKLVVAEGDWIVALVRTTATHTGRFRDLEPTGRHIVNNELTFHRVANERLAAMWSHSHEPSYYRQVLGESAS